MKTVTRRLCSKCGQKLRPPIVHLRRPRKMATVRLGLDVAVLDALSDLAVNHYRVSVPGLLNAIALAMTNGPPLTWDVPLRAAIQQLNHGANPEETLASQSS